MKRLDDMIVTVYRMYFRLSSPSSIPPYRRSTALSLNNSKSQSSTSTHVGIGTHIQTSVSLPLPPLRRRLVRNLKESGAKGRTYSRPN